MASNIFSAALTGMNAAQYGITTTEHNIANASTPGFSRQQVLLSAGVAQQLGAGFIGQGVDVSGVRRIYDQFLNTQVLQEQTQASYLTSYHSSLAQIENMFSDPVAGVAPAMHGLFDTMHGVANNPESIPSRQTFLGNAQATVNRFQSIDQQLTSLANGLTGQINSSVNDINSYAQQIATLNNNIKRAIAGGPAGQQPNDLLDQRDQLINQVNQQIKTTVLKQPDGTLSVFIGNGQALVIDDKAMSLQVVQSANDPSKVDIAYLANGKTVNIQQSSLQGGSLGAYLTFRDQSLEPARNALGRVAIGLATSLNQQNQLGQDLNGVLGGNLFNVAVPRVSQNANNTGTATMAATITNVSALTTSDYQLKFDGTNYSMVRLSDNKVTNLGAGPLTPSAVIDGFTANITAGAMAAGDSFLIRPTADGGRDISMSTTDPAKIAAAAPMRATAALTNTGTASISNGTVNSPPPTNANLQSPVSLTFTSPTTFTVSGAVPAVAGAVTYTSGQNISYNGWTVKITGTPAAGDIFNVTSNTNAVGDSRNALVMAGLQTQNLMANGTASFGGIYGQLVGDIGVKTREMDITSQAQNNVVAKSVASQQAVSGVNLDEEAANLLRYQKAYQASAKAMQIASSMFDLLLTLGK